MKIKNFLLHYLKKCSRVFGRYEAKITYVPASTLDNKKYQGILYVRYPEWMTWMEDAEEKAASEYGAIWYGEFSGRLNYDIDMMFCDAATFRRLMGSNAFTEPGH